MRAPMWRRLGLSEDEWIDCQRAALEMSLAEGARVPARQVAVEFALARAFDASAHAAPPVAPPAATPAPRMLRA